MTRRLRLNAATLVLALLSPFAKDAVAGTDTGTLGVSVRVQDVCSIEGGVLDFGTYNGSQGEDADATGSISYFGCTTGQLTFSLDAGQSGDIAGRAMQGSGNSSLTYQLYRNEARTLAWGQGADAMKLNLLRAGSGSVPVYGRIDGGQSVTPGVYSDAVNITLTF